MAMQVIAAERREHSTNRFYRPELDVLRFIAFLLVFFSHTIPIKEHSPHWLLAIRNAGAFGVPVFFGLSAFLITELLFREKDVTNGIDIKAFYARRILRIWPVYFAVLICGFIISRFPGHIPINRGSLAAYFLLIGNWYSIIYGFLPMGLGPLWSIAVEEQFYLVWPSLVRFGKKNTVIIICAALWIVSQISVFVLCFKHVSIERIWINSLVHVQYFATGATFSIFLRGVIPKLSAILRSCMFLSGISSFFIANFIFNAYMWNSQSSLFRTYPGYLIADMGVFLILYSIMGSNIGRFSLLRYFGKISYGLYVYHLPIALLLTWAANLYFRNHISFVTVGIGLPLTILTASASYRYFESWFLRLKEQFEIVKSRAI